MEQRDSEAARRSKEPFIRIDLGLIFKQYASCINVISPTDMTAAGVGKMTSRHSKAREPGAANGKQEESGQRDVAVVVPTPYPPNSRLDTFNHFPRLRCDAMRRDVRFNCQIAWPREGLSRALSIHFHR
ncbi:hypothetical protein HYFRA_00011909 [Hymenoscyphus fraxineus]|uniref:Uncharacterized protein n=1 Tax=Hymenoscyphus fraxineus TaxID=746836 RepID=A0A9N9L2X7_9HELO|nr:hypothetical protein HYFRA_00011909 [Hymenoscyphus fraxineus]